MDLGAWLSQSGCTTVLAVYGAALATAVACLDLARFLRDRPRLRIEVSAGYRYAPGDGTQIADFTLDLNNVGHRPLSVVEVGYKFKGEGKVRPAIPGDGSLEISEGQTQRVHLAVPRRPLKDIEFIYAKDSYGRIYKASRKTLGRFLKVG